MKSGLIAIALLSICAHVFSQEVTKPRSIIEQQTGVNFNRNLDILLTGLEKLGETRITLFESDEIVEDLGLSQKQLDKVRSFKDSYPTAPDLFELSSIKGAEAIGSLSEARANAAAKEIRMSLKAVHDDIRDDIKETLSPGQALRLDQIHRQKILLSRMKYKVGPAFGLSKGDSEELSVDLIECDKQIFEQVTTYKWEAYAAVLATKVNQGKIKKLLGEPLEKREPVWPQHDTSESMLPNAHPVSIDPSVAVEDTPLHLIRSKKVAAELELSSDQVAKLLSLNTITTATRSQSEKHAQFDDILAVSIGRQEESRRMLEDQVGEILTTKQRTRLHEIHRQEMLYSQWKYGLGASFGLNEKASKDLIPVFVAAEKKIAIRINEIRWIAYSNSLTRRIGNKFDSLVGKPFYVDAVAVRREVSSPRRKSQSQSDGNQDY